MKKIIYSFFLVLLFTGCTSLSNTPIKRTEEFLKKYQTLDNDVLSDLNKVIGENYSLNTTQSDTYRSIMKKHYQNLTYEIKEDVINGDDATVTVEITVTDFKKVMDEAEQYMNDNVLEFNDETGNYSISKYNDYRLEKMKEARDKVKYTIYLSLTKKDKKWEMNDINQATYDKINGIYNY